MRPFVLLAVVSFAGCPRSRPAPETPLELVRVRTPAARGPALVVIHGLGANERDLLPLAEAVAPTTQAIGLRAPIDLGGGRFSWFPVRFTDEGPIHDVAAAEQSRRSIVGTLERLAVEPTIDPSAITLIGFSQGAMLSEEVLRTEPRLVAGAVLIGGRTLGERPAPTSRARPRALIIHGTRDPIVPYAGTTKTREVLERDGFPVELKSFDAGHQVTPEMVDAIRAWLNAK